MFNFLFICSTYEIYFIMYMYFILCTLNIIDAITTTFTITVYVLL